MVKEELDLGGCGPSDQVKGHTTSRRIRDAHGSMDRGGKRDGFKNGRVSTLFHLRHSVLLIRVDLDHLHLWSRERGRYLP